MSVQAARRFFSADEYHRMGEAGIFSEDDRVELIEGEILKMSPIGSRHAATVKRLNGQLNRLLGDRVIVSVQDPILLNDFSEPQPDIAILRRRDDFYAQSHPTAADALLIIEIADTSVEYDHGIKLPAYARSAVPEVWIVDLPAETVAVHANLANGVFRAVSTYQRGDSRTPLRFPDLSIEVVRFFG